MEVPLVEDLLIRNCCSGRTPKWGGWGSFELPESPLCTDLWCLSHYCCSYIDRPILVSFFWWLWVEDFSTVCASHLNHYSKAWLHHFTVSNTPTNTVCAMCRYLCYVCGMLPGTITLEPCGSDEVSTWSLFVISANGSPVLPAACNCLTSLASALSANISTPFS